MAQADMPFDGLLKCFLLLASQRPVFTKLALSTCIGLMGFALGGCVAFRQSADPSSPPLVGQRMVEKDLQFISPGVTSRDEVIAKLGQPPLELEGFSTLAYPWTELRRTLFIIGGGAAGAGGFALPEYRDVSLFVAIGKDGRVLKWGLDQMQRADSFSIVAQARRWAQSNEMPLPSRQVGFPPRTSAPGQGAIVVHRRKPKGTSLFRAATPWPVGLAIDGQFRAELLDAEYVVVLASPGSHQILVHPAPPYRDVAGTSVGSVSGIHSSALTLEVAANALYFLEAQATLKPGWKW
jgi:hypothetical protein